MAVAGTDEQRKNTGLVAPIRAALSDVQGFKNYFFSVPATGRSAGAEA